MKPSAFMTGWKAKAKGLKVQVHALYLAYRDPRVPWYAKALSLMVVAYALSPIDLIPDFIPVLGYLDDLIILPAGIWLVLRLVPPEVMAECRQIALAEQDSPKPVFRWMGAVIIVLWVLVIVWAGLAIYRAVAVNR